MLSQKLSMTGKRDKVGMWDGDEETDLVWDGFGNLSGAHSHTQARTSSILMPNRFLSSSPARHSVDPGVGPSVRDLCS